MLQYLAANVSHRATMQESGLNHAPFRHLEVPDTGWTFHVMAASDRPNSSRRITLAGS
jgi:hypothetical protein